MIKLRDILKEIGEGSSKPYKYKFDSQDGNDIMYTFTTEESKTDYEVDLFMYTQETYAQQYGVANADKIKFPAMDISFRQAGGDYDEETNTNEQYRIMATVVAISKEMLSKQPKITTLLYAPTKADKDDMRRANLYKAYIQKQLPGSTVSSINKNGKYIIELPNN